MIEKYRRNLPHWRMDGATYFVTWRLHQNQSLLQPLERTLVQESILYFNDIRYNLHAYVVMDDHVHVLLTPSLDWNLTSITHSWKSFTANQMQRDFRREGSIWQKESFDRIIRNEEEYIQKGNYILNNPFARWPDIESYKWVGIGDK